jgi:hypothetical protein
VLFTPECSPTASISAQFKDDGINGVNDLKEPFRASVTPQTYATGAATVIAWMLVVMLLITPRTFFIGGAGGGGVGMLNRHGMISGAQGSASVIGVGSRPWLQKVAALTVAVSLTIATADTFDVAERQYATGFMNAEALRAEVVGSNEIKVSRVISDIFLWLAQVQTLIRLFPRHKEKVLIKWIGFALIILDATFSCLNSFMGNPIGRPRRFRDAIPALSYLFQLALSMLYAAWVIYYALCKRKYAFYHKDMWNVSLVALLAIVAILTPVVFFITDISNSSVAGWGDYFRWVGAAAASVIVWEWVERIEALEREEKKDGILGREIFDGDEMLDSTPSEEVIWPRHRRFWSRDPRNGGGPGGNGAYTSGQDPLDNQVSSRFLHLRSNGGPGIWGTPSQSHRPLSRVVEAPSDTQLLTPNPRGIPTPPPVAVSPISRTDTTSAASTVYTVRYHTIGTPVPPLVRHSPEIAHPILEVSAEQRLVSAEIVSSDHNEKDVNETGDAEGEPEMGDAKTRFHIGNPFKRKRALPPAEVRNGQVIDPVSLNNSRQQPAHNYEPWDIKNRLGTFAAEQGEKWREKRIGNQTDVDLPVTIIPAQPRGRTWSPDVPVMGEPSSTVKDALPVRHEFGEQRPEFGGLGRMEESSGRRQEPTEAVIDDDRINSQPN